jgi:hypothetical protein
MRNGDQWRLFGAGSGSFEETPPGHHTRVIHPGIRKDRSGAWLRNAVLGLGVLAGAAAVVSFSAQFQMIYTARQQPVVAAMEAAIPDAAAMIFASLGIALALHGRRAIRARMLNVAAVGTSMFMNAIAATPGWRSLAIWLMPPVAYALASDTLIGVSLGLVILWAVFWLVRLAGACATGVADMALARLWSWPGRGERGVVSG